MCDGQEIVKPLAYHVTQRITTKGQMAKTQFLQIRLSPEDRRRVERVADAEHLEPSTWARRVILQTVEAFESSHGGQNIRVREAPQE